MTKRMERLTGKPISVTVCHDAPGRLERTEQVFLKTANVSAQVREVVLSAEGEKLLVARTVFISRRLRACQKLRALGCRPLGVLLFSQGDAEWRLRDFVRLTPKLPIWRCVQSNLSGSPKGAWARRTLYVLDDSPICVTEVMLPALLKSTHHIFNPLSK
jgi:chorismate-pyruvate lyase